MTKRTAQQAPFLSNRPTSPPEIAQRLNALSPSVQVAMSLMAYAELLKGAERSTRRAHVLQQIKQLT